MWKIINKVSFVLLLLFLFTSCDKDEYSVDASRDSKQISFEIAVNKATATTSNAGTRVSTSSTYQTTFDEGDEMGVYIVKGDGGLQSSGNWVDNLKLRYSDGRFIPEFPSGKEYYPAGGEPLSFYAYYPYQKNIADATNLEFSVQTDQRDKNNLSKSDFLTASTLNQVNANGPVKLNFRHLFALVELSVTDGGIGAQMSDEIDVRLETCLSRVNLNLATETISQVGISTAVRMYRVEQQNDRNYFSSYTYRAFIPAQTVAANTELFRFTQTARTVTRTLSHKPLGSVTLAQGEVKPYNITLQPQTSGITYNVGDYYPKNGFPIIGIVIETRNGGKNGKVISLDETREVKWGNPAVDEQAAGVVGIRDINDGQAGTRNLIAKRKDEPNFATTYGAFNWIHQTKNKGDVNGIWYMPSINELEIFWDLWNLDRTEFSKKLNDAGGTKIYADGYLWSSTESNDFKFAKYIHMPSGSMFETWYDKSYYHSAFIVRAFTKF